MRKIKKIVTLLLTLVFVASNTIYSFANENSTLSSDVPHETCIITLTSPNGIKYNVMAVEEPQMQLRSSNGDIAKTYSYSLDSKNMQRVTPSTRGGQSNDEWDDSISVHGYIYPIKKSLPDTFFIKGADCLGWGTWKRGWDLFNSNGSELLHCLKERSLTRTFDFEGSYPYTRMLERQVNHQNQITAKFPSSNTFSYSTGYTTYVSDIATGVLGANSHIDLNHAGSGTWSLDVTCNYFDNNILDYL